VGDSAMPEDSLIAALPPAVPAVPAAPDPPDARLAVVARLRGAGCVFAEDEAELLIGAASTPAELATMLDQRVAGLPLEHVLGWAEFCGLRLIVGPGVFVPRRRSEFLVRRAVASMAEVEAGGRAAELAGRRPHGARRRAMPVVLDLCCGSGAVGLAVATALGGAELHAADIDPGAIGYARRNLAAAGGQVHEGDLYDPLPPDLRGRVDILVVNAPYVPTGEIGLMPPEARLHEPVVALDGGADGVRIHRRVAAEASDWLAPGGSLLIETSHRQAALTAAAMAVAGLEASTASDDNLDATVVIGRLPSGGGRARA
jgi:release factor glutamine methyltransferase